MKRPVAAITILVTFAASAQPDLGTPIARGVKPLASLPYPVATTIAPLPSPRYVDGATVVGPDGIVRLAKVADPGGSGQQVYLHRVVRTDARTDGTRVGVSVRSEKVWIDQGKYLKPGGEYWLAFAFRPKAGEWPTQQAGLTDDGFLVFQTHSESNGDTQPPIALDMDTGTGVMRWRTSWGTGPQATTQTGVTIHNKQPLPPVDVWRKYVVHIKPGWLASQEPLTEVWESIGSGPFVKLFSSTAPNDYNWDTGTYPRVGIYKWAGTNWPATTPSIACYLSTLYMGQGANLFEAAAAAVAAFR